MIIVVYPGAKARVIDSDDYELVSSLYNSFVDGVDVFRSLYPMPFLKTLSFESGIYETSSYELRRLFLSWCYENARRISKELWERTKSICSSQGSSNRPAAANTDHTDIFEDVVAHIVEDGVEPLSELQEALPVSQEKTYLPFPISENGISLFKKRPIVCCELQPHVEETLEELNKTNHKYDDSIHEACTAAVYFYNSATRKSGLAFFDKKEGIDERAFLSSLDAVGIKDVEIRWVFMLPQTELSYCLIEHYNIESQESKEQIETLAKIVKTLNPQKEKTVFVKGILEFIYNNYTFDWGSKVMLKDFYEEMKRYNVKKFRFALNTFIDEKVFARLLVHCFFEMSGNCILNLRKRTEEKTVSLDLENKIAALLKVSHVAQKTHQLRSEPPCKTNYVGPWGMSSHVEFGSIEDFSKKIL